MNAHALLKSQGWRGHGHTLHPTDDSTGLAKPLLLSRKDNTLGIGKKEHCTSDQWWLNAFDQQLQGLDTTSQKGAIVQTVSHGALNTIETRGAASRYTGAYGLYASFVRGGLLEGTISSSTTSSGDSTPAPPDGDIRLETKSERKARRALKRRERAEKKAVGGLDVDAILAERKKKKTDRKGLETRQEKKARREAKRKRKEERRRGTAG